MSGRFCILVAALTAVEAMSAEAVHKPVTPQQAHDWLLRVIPLPKEVVLESKVVVPVSGVRVSIQQTRMVPHVLAANELLADLKRRGGEQASTAETFTLLVGLLDAEGKVAGRAVPGADRLSKLANSEQAYLIRPLDDSTLVVTGLDTKGVFYGVKTLRQLLVPTFKGEGAAATVDLPLATVVDWPDLAERGEWGGSANRDLEWMAERKMNLCESHCQSLTVTADGKGVAEFDKSLLERGAACAVKVVPIITHLDQLQSTGLFSVFPQTLGVGDPKTWPYGGTTVKPACFSKPETARALADWMVSLAEQPEITDLNVWLSEHHVACKCDECNRKGQFALEAEAVARGYVLARKTRPDLKLRVLLTQGSYEYNEQVLNALPREIGITYYDGGRTYDSSREPMIYPLLEKYAAEGGWLGCYPQLTASWRIVCPWSGPQFIKYRLTEFVDKKLQCLCGYATPDNRFYDFNVNAAAEWAWNAHGRDEREFALAYFTQRGVAEPQKAADWAVKLGPVGWDVYGARVPYSWFFGGAAQAVRTGSVPALGGGPYRYLPDEARLAEDVALCAEASRLADEVGDPAMVAETRVIEGYVKMLKAIRDLGQTVGKQTELTEAAKRTAAQLMGELDGATNQTVEGLLAWQQAAAPDAASSRFDDTVQVTEQTCADIGAALSRFGIDDPGRPYRKKPAGTWKTADFADGPEVTKRWDVTDLLGGPGSYRLQFVYRSGWYGLNISKASLCSATKEAPDELTPVAADDHQGTAAHKNVDNTYTFEIAAPDPKLRYFLVAEVRGCPKDSPPDKQGCEGEVLFWKQRPE